MKKTCSLKLINCGLADSHVFVNLKGFTKGTTIDEIKKIMEVDTVIRTIAVRSHEKLVFTDEIEVVEENKNACKVLLHFQRVIKPYDQLEECSISHSFGPEHLKAKLSSVADYREAASIGAEYAVQEGIPALKIIFMDHQNKEGVARIVNHRIYKKVSPTNTKLVERFVNNTGCLLMKNIAG
jgi:hypothetical protein